MQGVSVPAKSMRARRFFTGIKPMILVAAASKAVRCKQLVIFTAFSPMIPRRRGSKGSALLTTCFFHCLFAHDTGFRRIHRQKDPQGCVLARPPWGRTGIEPCTCSELLRNSSLSGFRRIHRQKDPQGCMLARPPGGLSVCVHGSMPAHIA